MPRNVRRFEWLMYGGFVASWLVTPFNARFYESLARFHYTAIVLAIILSGLRLLIIWGIARKRLNWLRWTMLVLFAIGLPFSVPDAWHEFPAYAVDGSRRFFELAYEALALWFVFTGDAVAWFRRAPAAA